MIRVQVTAPTAVLKAGLESVIAAAPGLAITDGPPDVLLTSMARDDLTPAPAIVLLGEPRWSAELFRLGVRALLPHDASPAEIVAAVEAAAAGLAVVDPAELESLLAADAPVQPTADPGPLTARELEVLRLLADGVANKNIAWQLQISEHTVKFHVAQILSKLNAGTRTEAVTQGIRRGLILL